MLASDTDIKETILSKHDDIISIFVNGGKLPRSLRETVDKHHKRLIEKRKEFSEELCQVVVSGEISAGKSSLLNFLIGRDVLPTSVRESRSVTCRLRYGTEKTAKLIDDSGNEIDDLKYDESNEALDRLKKLIKGDEFVQGLSYIDIFLEEVSLQGNVVLVDTPGIKEEIDDDNSQLFTHLWKASAFIYILKTDSNLGTHKLFRIKKKVQELKQDGYTELCSECMLYVCNRWDQVDDSEAEEVYDEVLSRLRSNGIEVREGQLMKLSVKKEKKRQSKGKPLSDQYKLFIDKLRGLISLAVRDRYRRECQWLEKALNDVISHGTIVLKTLSKTVDERKRRRTEYEKSVVSLKEALDTPKRNYCREIINIYTTLAANLHKHLRTEEFCSKIIEKCKSEMERERSSLRTKTLEELEKVAVKTFQQIINEEITRWRETNDVDNACAPVCEKVLQSFRMLEKNVEKGLVESRKSSCPEISFKNMESAQVPVNEISENYPSRTFTENVEREYSGLSYIMAQAPIIAKETLDILDNAAEENSTLVKKSSSTMNSAQVPLSVENRTPKGKENDLDEDTRLLITNPSSVRSAQVHVPDEELEMIRMRIEKGDGEDTQLFTKGEKVGLALTAPLWFPIAVTASVFVVPVSAFKVLSKKFSEQKAESNFREVTDKRNLAELLQEIYKSDTFSEARFNDEFERNSIRLFNQWLHQQHEASIQVIEDISTTLQQLAETEKLESEDKQSVERFLQQLKECQEECCVISEKCCNSLNQGSLS
eukprot:XP_011451822.1 PREDICTED: uncharacterized protein LOC105345389 [Crassostrea gigas]